MAARARVAAGVAVAVARAHGVALPPLRLLEAWGPPVAVEVAPSEQLPGVVGLVYEALLDPARRRSGGAFYTPSWVALVVAGWALAGRLRPRPVVCDPAVGGGAFLLAAAEILAGDGVDRAEVVGHSLVGADLDPVAAATTEAVLALWCNGLAVPRVVVGDALAMDPQEWPEAPDVVVGNPPFLGQLARRHARRAEDVVALRRRLGGVVTPYADTAVLFLAQAVDLVRPGGAVALILPESFLATRDAQATRAAVLADAHLEALWVPSAPVFDTTTVRVCVPVLRRSGPRRGPVRLWRGAPPRLVATVEADADALGPLPTWSHLVAEGSAVPAVDLDRFATVGEWCEVRADFRDAYYGVAPFLVDDPEGDLDHVAFPPLVTVGLIDPGECLWGRRPARHSRRTWAAPRVDGARLAAETDLGPWARSRLVPKVVVATQTRVVEAAVDTHGRWLPSTPLISVVADPERLWHLAAALLAPPVTAWAVRHCGGSARSSGALKLSASQVRALPSPPSGAAWDEAADAVRAASSATDATERRRWLEAAATASSQAYGVDDPAVFTWWQDRLPRPR